MHGNARDLKQRLRATRKVLQETQALQRIAAERMVRSRTFVDAQRAYEERLREMVAALGALPDLRRHRLLDLPADRPAALVAFGGDRGLCGAFNSVLAAGMQSFAREACPRGCALSILGKAVADRLRRAGVPVERAAPQPSLRTYEPALRELATALLQGLAERRYASLHVLYAVDNRTLRLETRLDPVFPFPPAASPSARHLQREISHSLLEPAADTFTPLLAFEFLRASLVSAYLNSMAAEQAARHVTMSRASENAGKMIDELTLLYHRVRQDAITAEMAEITAGGQPSC
jgi:F-type H+-transporting ATPase subunit gamma